ncbi:virulence-associated E family protein [Neobacillus sp. Marseille-QA0830]
MNKLEKELHLVGASEEENLEWELVLSAMWQEGTVTSEQVSMVCDLLSLSKDNFSKLIEAPSDTIQEALNNYEDDKITNLRNMINMITEPAINVSSVIATVNKELERYNDRVVSNARNLEKIFSCEIFLGVLAYNEFAGREVIKGDLPWRNRMYSDEPFEPWTDMDDRQLRHWLDREFDIRGKDLINNALSNTMTENRFHPIKDFIQSEKWDGKERVESIFIEYFGADDNKYTRSVTRKWFIAAVKRVFEPGCKFDEMIVLRGAQGIGKSELCTRLSGGYFEDNLDKFDSKEAGEKLKRAWIIEMAEMSQFKKKEVEEIKGFLSRRSDNFREAYSRNVQENPRHSVFIGTTNKHEILTDSTGNRRFWIVSCNKGQETKNVFNDLTPEEIAQIWAEAYELYISGEPLNLSDEVAEMAMEVQELYTIEDPLEQTIRNYLDQHIHRKEYVCAGEIWDKALLRSNDMSKWDSHNISEILQNLGWTKGTRKNIPDYGKCVVFNRPKGYPNQDIPDLTKIDLNLFNQLDLDSDYELQVN